MNDQPLGIRDVLRVRDYRFLFGGQVISDIGDGITFLLILLVINHTTGSTMALALMAIAQAVPAFTVGLVAGVYADRWNRRSIMLASDLARAVIVLAFGLVQAPELLPLLYALAFLQASVGTFFRPARGALLPHIVPERGLAAANGLAQASQVIGSVIGAGMAGLIFGTFGSGTIGFAIDAVTFLVSFALVSRIAASAGEIRGDVRASAAAAGLRASLGEGFAVVRGSRILVGIVLSVGVTMLGLGAVNVLFVPLVVNELRVSATWMAGIDAAQTVGMLVAAALVASLVRRVAPTTIISSGLLGIGASIGALAGATAIWHVLAILVLVGLFVTPVQAVIQTLVQTAVVDASRGRVVSVVQATMSTASVASMALGGIFGDLIGIRGVFIAAGVLTVGASVLSHVLFRGTTGGQATPTPVAAGSG